MKKLIVFLLCFLSLFTLCGCGQESNSNHDSIVTDSDNNDPASSSSSQKDDYYKSLRDFPENPTCKPEDCPVGQSYQDFDYSTDTNRILYFYGVGDYEMHWLRGNDDYLIAQTVDHRLQNLDHGITAFDAGYGCNGHVIEDDVNGYFKMISEKNKTFWYIATERDLQKKFLKAVIYNLDVNKGDEIYGEIHEIPENREESTYELYINGQLIEPIKILYCTDADDYINKNFSVRNY
ncbi:MAG: hypothetical protein IKS51_00085 [Erysipelotrichaceae bacterium]|nr:hypothetical protein [Erysipelotrichaceae bacterium]